MMKKNFLLIVPSLRLGGQERIAANTVEILKTDYNVQLIVFDNSNPVYHPDCAITNLDIPSSSNVIKKIINIVRRTILLRRIIKIGQIDYTYSFGNSANIVNVLSKKKNKVVTSIHGFADVHDSIINRIIIRKCDLLIGCSQTISNHLKLLFPKYEFKVRCLYNPYNFSEIFEKSLEIPNDYEFNNETVISHGRLNHVKNYPRLIKAIAIVKQKRPNVQLLLIGEGDERKRLEKLIKRYELQRTVTLLGFKSNPYAYLSKAHLFVLSSYSEGFPNALIEGMCFLPSISVDCKSGPSEILSCNFSDNSCTNYIETDFGVLVQCASNYADNDEINNDDVILAEAILYMLNDKKKLSLFKEKARSRVREYSYSAYKNTLYSYFNNL